jgi:flagellar hook protein FlgE
MSTPTSEAIERRTTMPSFYIPLSGLDADNTALNTIANNLSNMNTTGFKAQTTNFSDLFYQQVGTTGAGGEIQQGTGVQVASNSTDFTGGSISSTGVATNVAIDGTGFFVLDNGGGAQLYTRDGNFQLSSTGTLESTEGQGVMGYAATNGVINAGGGLSDITIPTGQVMQPAATSTFSMTQNLDSASPIGAQTTGQVQVYDSLGKSYEATVTYTNLGNNSWSYNITLPDTLTPASATATTISNTGGLQGMTQSSTTASGITTLSYNFGSSGGNLATVDPGTTLTITGPLAVGVGTATITAPTVTAGETVANYATALNAALVTAGIKTGATGVTISATASGQLSIVGPSATLSTAGIVKQDLAGTILNYNFGSSGATMATVDQGTNLTISGPTATGGTATITAPVITAGETAVSYVAALNAAVTAAGITGVTVTGPTATGQVTITSLGTNGSIIQDTVGSASTNGTLVFDTSGNLVTPAANVGGISFGGLSDDAATMNMTWGLYSADGDGNISQTAAASGQSAQNQNGYASGEYQSFTIGSDGTVTATYSNGQSQSVGQLAIATVSNQQGLVDTGSTEYQATASSGLATVGVAGAGGRGTLEGSSLEASNVNISAEFSDLIVAQRAFEANAKSVTTFDTITQETINMIH